jgi:hypothetical protein
MPPPSNRRPFPDKAHEDLARWVEETLANLDDSLLLVDTLFSLNDAARTETGANQADVGDSLLLVDVLFSLLDAATTQISALSARVAALEPALFTNEESPSA